MPARKKTAKKAAPKKAAPKKVAKTGARKRPVFGAESSEEVRLGGASDGCDPALWAELLTEFPRLTEADRTVAELYCGAMEQRNMHKKNIAVHGPLVVKGMTKGGDTVYGDNPSNGHLRGLDNFLTTLAKEFGGTPKARAVKKNQKPSQAAVPGKPDTGRFFRARH